MILNSFQMTETLRMMSEKLVDDWETKTPSQRFNFSSMLFEQIGPVLSHLPEGTKVEELLEMQEFFRKIAIDLMVKRMRKNLIYKDEPEVRLLENLSEREVINFARYLLTITIVALEVMPRSQTIEDIVNDFDSLDIDAEFAELLHSERRDDQE